jgi:plastocyanin
MKPIRILVSFGLILATGGARAEYREIEVKDPASITGQVRVIGEIPELPPQPVFKQTEVCGTSLPDERLVTGAGGTLANAVVYLADVKAGKAGHLEQPIKLTNKKCQFVPHVLSATVGQTLEIHNDDPFLHDAHGLLGSKTLFNRAILKGQTVRVPLSEMGLVRINCNIRHTWMHAYLFVAEHPYHAVTDADGRFRLDGVPPGVWSLHVWHELLGSAERQVRLKAGEVQEVQFNLRAVAEEEAH